MGNSVSKSDKKLVTGIYKELLQEQKQQQKSSQMAWLEAKQESWKHISPEYKW